MHNFKNKTYLEDQITQNYKYASTRESFGGRRNLVWALNVQWTSLTDKSEFQIMTTEHGFSHKSGFKKIVLAPSMV